MTTLGAAFGDARLAGEWSSLGDTLSAIRARLGPTVQCNGVIGGDASAVLKEDTLEDALH